jgi:hypothetical protein
MISSIPELKNLKIVPRMLRPSILLQAAPENDGRIQLGLAIGQHGRSAGQPYQDKWPTRLLYDRHAEKYQKALETLIVANLDEAATRLGITKEELIEGLDLSKIRAWASFAGTFSVDRTMRGGLARSWTAGTVRRC